MTAASDFAIRVTNLAGALAQNVVPEDVEPLVGLLTGQEIGIRLSLQNGTYVDVAAASVGHAIVVTLHSARNGSVLQKLELTTVVEPVAAAAIAALLNYADQL